ncbi:hypothetical protein ACFV4P_34505 [Kitasatospora sp. NPDC059795]|uniref:hypothetical protein n=1 Tax=Kitasatospora sp. NPDC059795 TaxID=3346949 RepID=UPI0036655E18
MTDHTPHHSGEIRLDRGAMRPRETDGSTWPIADETDTVLQAVDTLRSGQEMSDQFLRAALRDTHRLINRLTAVQEELLLYAREAASTGKPRLTWREIGDEVGLHFTTTRERHKRVAATDSSPWRTWLVQNTGREDMYPTPDGQPALGKLVTEHPGEPIDR